MAALVTRIYIRPRIWGFQYIMPFLFRYCHHRNLHSNLRFRSRKILLVVFFLFTLGIFLNHIYFFIVTRNTVHLSDISAMEKTLKRPLKSTMLHINGRIKRLGAVKQIYIINLSNRTDRRTGSIALFQTLHLDAFIVPAYRICSPEIISRIHLVHNGYVTLPELACWASHMQVWLEIAALDDKDSWALVSEDDIDLEMTTFDVLESLPRTLWNIPDMIYLGHCGDPLGPTIYDAVHGYRLHRAIYPSCTHAYAIRPHAASKLIHLLSSPRRAIDDEIVLLVHAEKILAYSIHPPLALQQSITSLYPSDVNPQKHTLLSRFTARLNFVSEWWRGVKFTNRLINSTLARADFRKAEDWRKKHENALWQTNTTSLSCFSYVK